MKRVLRQRLRQTAIVTLKSGNAFRGVLWEWDSEAFVLRNSEHLETGTDRIPTPVDGELVMLANEVDCIQFV